MSFFPEILIFVDFFNILLSKLCFLLVIFYNEVLIQLILPIVLIVLIQTFPIFIFDKFGPSTTIMRCSRIIFPKPLDTTKPNPGWKPIPVGILSTPNPAYEEKINIICIFAIPKEEIERQKEREGFRIPDEDKELMERQIPGFSEDKKFLEETLKPWCQPIDAIDDALDDYIFSETIITMGSTDTVVEKEEKNEVEKEEKK